MTGKLGMAAAIAVAATIAAGCSNFGESFETTSALPATPKVDPVCQQLATSIDSLRREGIPAKVEKAAAKKYRMTAADLTKAAQLNRANDDFQSRCSTLPRNAPTTASSAVKGPPAATPAVKISGASPEATPYPDLTAATTVRTARAPATPEPITAAASAAASSP